MSGTPWRLSAACMGRDLEMFFATSGPDLSRARAVCAICPVRPECLEDAEAYEDEYGVRGGLTPGERRRLRDGGDAAQPAVPVAAAPLQTPAPWPGHAERARADALAVPLLSAAIGILAAALGVPAGPVCIRCRRGLRRCKTCPYCGLPDARPAGWPVSRRAGAA